MLGHITVRGLARTDNHATVRGDSGGGWSFNNTVYGVHSGGGSYRSYFTPIEKAQSVLGVQVMVAN